MACLQLTSFVPVRVMKVSIFMSIFFVLPVKTGFGTKQTGTCRPFCAGSDCITVHLHKEDFNSAEQACRDKNGELMTLRLKTDENLLDLLNQEFYGDFWIGLHLPAGACSNLSAPLRGYEWTSASVQSSFIPSFGNWKDSVKVCHPRCVSLSNDRKWTERLCTDKTDGYLCKTKHKDACQAQELSNTVFFPSSAKVCPAAPCEHICKDVKGGYECSCFEGYIPDSKKPRQCILHCAKEKCPAICEGASESDCSCPVGFIRVSKLCEDIDECAMDGCDQRCKNTYGSFVCSCWEGFVLKDQIKCIKKDKSKSVLTTTAIAIGSVRPAVKNDTLTGSTAHTGGFVWIWVFLIVVVVLFIVGIRFYVVQRQKRREQNSIHQSPVPVDNVE